MTSPIEQKVESILSPLQAFARDETVSSVILFLATGSALALANSSLAASYFALINLPVSVAAGDLLLEFRARSIVNDGLMTIFFLVLGLEIKRELLVGEMRDKRLAITVMAAALGGMLFPALIYTGINWQLSSVEGWGIPMATDTAFALGVLMLLGNRIPSGLRAFLVAFAIIDDLGAILVIALFYTHGLSLVYMEGALLCALLLVLCNVGGLRHISIYLFFGVLLWGALIQAGVHGTVAGVLVAAAVPARPERGGRWLVRRSRRLASDLESMQSRAQVEDMLGDADQHRTAAALGHLAQSGTTPLRRWESSLTRPVLLVILPLFALVNAGIPFSVPFFSEVIASPVTWGIVVGLIGGKVTGITLLSWIALRTGLGRLPSGMTMRHVAGLALLGGMGFTMSIFIADLSFSSLILLDAAKLAVLGASVLAGALGYLWLRFVA